MISGFMLKDLVHERQKMMIEEIEERRRFYLLSPSKRENPIDHKRKAFLKMALERLGFFLLF